jgi:hypothetical protein
MSSRGHGGGQLDLGVFDEANTVDVQPDLVTLSSIDDAVI